MTVTAGDPKDPQVLLDGLLRTRAAYSGCPTTEWEDRQSLAEVMFLHGFGRSVADGDLVPRGKRLQFIGKDDSGRRVKVVHRPYLPFRVWSRGLDGCDLIVFVLVNQDRTDVVGWLPIARVEQAPVVWWEENGVKTDYAHEISQAVLNPIPSGFDFVEKCLHVYVTDQLPGAYGGIWNDTQESWDCFGCEQRVDDYRTRERVKRALVDGHGDPVLPREERDERPAA